MDEILEEHLDRLDALTALKGSIFRSELDKERYESLLTYALRKYGAAHYHSRNLVAHIEEDKGLIESLTFKSLPGGESGNNDTFTFTKSCDPCAYELSAFLEALKSALDLLAEGCSVYLSGVEVNYSIQPLIRLVQKGRTGPILEVVSQNLKWLIRLREYRHHLVHRLMPSLQTGHRTETLGSATAKVNFPVVVPCITPSFTPDTRASRAKESREDHITGLDRGRAVGTIRRSDGTEEIVRFQLSAQPSQGYVAIEQFVSEHLYNFESLFRDLIEVLNALNFKTLRPREGGG